MDKQQDERLARIERTVGMLAEAARAAQSEFPEVMRAVLTAIGNLTSMIEAIHEACTSEHPPSPLIEPLNQLAIVIGEQTTRLEAKLEELTEAVKEQPETIRGVVRQELGQRIVSRE